MDFESIAQDLRQRLSISELVEGSRWQSVKAPMPMREVFNYSLIYDLPTEDLEFYRQQIKPNLPWADRHFLEERVSEQPKNPGKTWRIWPYSRSADTHRREGQEDPQFDHSYAERYWPKRAGTTPGGLLTDLSEASHEGIRFKYGDLGDLLVILSQEPTTRQAYLPIWFPEDLQAARDEKRVPCTLGYHFMVRGSRLHCNYYMRSCDFVRHFRDDVYLTIRLTLWVLKCCRKLRPEMGWDKVRPGVFTMHISSLHCFSTDKL